MKLSGSVCDSLPRLAKTSAFSSPLRPTGPRLRFSTKAENFAPTRQGAATKIESLRRLRRSNLPGSDRAHRPTNRAVLRPSRFLLTTSHLFRVRLLDSLRVCREAVSQPQGCGERRGDRARDGLGDLYPDDALPKADSIRFARLHKKHDCLANCLRESDPATINTGATNVGPAIHFVEGCSFVCDVCFFRGVFHELEPRDDLAQIERPTRSKAGSHAGDLRDPQGLSQDFQLATPDPGTGRCPGEAARADACAF